MEHTVHHVQSFNDVFLLGQAGYKGMDKANALWTELVNKEKVDEKTHVETWTPSKKWHELNALQDYIRYMINISKELNADFNFPRST